MLKNASATLAIVMAAFTGIANAGGQARAVADDFVPGGPVEPLPAAIEQVMAAIRAEALAAHIAFLASPSLEGRGLGSRGLDAATEYVAASLALARIPPLPSPTDKAPMTYFQSVPLREITGISGAVLVERRDRETLQSRSFVSGVDALFSESSPVSVSAPAVFAGYGIREPILGHEDYEGFDAAGRIVVILGGLPSGPEWRTPEIEARYAAAKPRRRFETKLAAAAAAGAVGVVAIEPADVFARALKDDAPAERFFLPNDQPLSRPALPLVRVSRAVAESALAPVAGKTPTAANDRPRALPGVTLTLSATGTERLVEGRNVVAFVAGSDEELRDRAIVIGAHLDHLGRSGETVYPGADDNASGVAALLEIGKALAASPNRPARSIVLAFWTGEEEGKLGSGHYVRHPLWPLERTEAYVNLDMIGHRWSSEEIRTLVSDSGCACGETFLPGLDPSSFVEPGLADWPSDLEPVLRRAARGLGLALHLDRTDGREGGSDYRDFARAGVPFVRFFGNFFPGYHEPGDTPDKLDASAAQQQARLCLATAWLLADASPH